MNWSDRASSGLLILAGAALLLGAIPDGNVGRKAETRAAARPQPRDRVQHSPAVEAAAIILPPLPPVEATAEIPASESAPKQTITPGTPPRLTPLAPTPQAHEAGTVPAIVALQPTPRRPVETVAVQETAPAPLPPTTVVEAEPPTVTAPAVHEVAVEDRALLRLLESDGGPDIRFSWPQSPGERARLYRIFTRCYGMQTVLMDRHNRLYRTEDPGGQAWSLDGDRYSGYVRATDGELVAEEAALARRIADHHRLASGSSVVRIFPRIVDAALIGGLRKALGDRFYNDVSVRGGYEVTGAEVAIRIFTVDGTSLTRSVVLPSPHRCAAN